MVATVNYIKRSGRESAIKIIGDSGSAIATLSDMSAHFQELNPDVVPQVDIKEMYWACASGASIQISRNSVVIATLSGSGSLVFGTGFMDNIENASDVEFTISGGMSTAWVVFAKTQGYRQTVEIANFSVYDNPNVHGE
jgi:hypothetical protein